MTGQPSSPTKATADAAAPLSPKSPKSPKSPHDNATNALQPPSHWTEQGMPERDDDCDSAIGSDGMSSTASISSSILEYRTVNGRTYHSERGNTEYWGPHDEKGLDGMDLQHHVWTLAYDDKLYLAPLTDDVAEVVDIGTGTGIWAIDFADAHPNARVVGTDLSPIQPAWIPPNLHFQIDDYTREWTFEENSLDYVHVRWLVGAVPDWNLLMEQAYRCLKPGGWVETWDLDGSFLSDDGSVTPKSALGQWTPIFKKFAETLAQKSSFCPVAEGLQHTAIKAAGFTDIQEKFVKIPVGTWPKDEKLKTLGQVQQAAIETDIEGWLSYAATTLGWTKEAITIFGAHMKKEFRDRKVHSYVPSLAVWAQKPLA